MQRSLLPLLCLALASCGAGDAVIASSARTALVGLHADDLRLCAGIADREARSPGGVFWTYDRSLPAFGFSSPIPGFEAGVNVSGAGECRVTFHIVDDRVRRIGYASAREAGVSPDAACAPVVRGCMRMLRDGSLGAP
ncbi:hypothetical protein [Falsiroseomonas oryziterrae]|uniref:hypothetical protein n=1 Tax=Falsiroseomonas oryziterrae TaxID=2911368 RepID=UPI001F3444FF|nr:hypothetical protein [Roseomonas sp. NPKOSM-4]